jgi:hypothetical protein
LQQPGGTDEPDEIDRLTQAVQLDPELLRPVIAAAGKLLAAAADCKQFEWPLAQGSKLIFDGAKTSGERVILSDGKAPPFGMEQAIIARAMYYLNTGQGRWCAVAPALPRVREFSSPKDLNRSSVAGQARRQQPSNGTGMNWEQKRIRPNNGRLPGKAGAHERSVGLDAK